MLKMAAETAAHTSFDIARGAADPPWPDSPWWAAGGSSNPLLDATTIGGESAAFIWHKRGVADPPFALSVATAVVL